jgi:3-methyladenine DNA glycosylase AlkD
MSSIQKLKQELNSLENKPQAAILQRFFKTGPGQYGEGDRFLGLKVPLQREIAKKYLDLDWKGLQELLASKIHEFRLVALLILVEQYEAAQDFKDKRNIVDFYLNNAKGINNWDLVDLSVYKILGDFLVRQEELLAKGVGIVALDVQKVLNKLVESANIWERRMAMVATYAFIKAGRSQETYSLAVKLLADEHDLIHKAVGWMLREAGKKVSTDELLSFLDKWAKTMPRTALRYAIEKLPPAQREHYLKLRN